MPPACLICGEPGHVGPAASEQVRIGLPITSKAAILSHWGNKKYSDLYAFPNGAKFMNKVQGGDLDQEHGTQKK